MNANLKLNCSFFTVIDNIGQEKLLEARFRVSLANMGEHLRILIVHTVIIAFLGLRNMDK